MNTKQAALGQALTTITEPPAAPPKAKRPKSKAENPPDKFTQRVASLHGRAPQNRLVDQTLPLLSALSIWDSVPAIC